MAIEWRRKLKKAKAQLDANAVPEANEFHVSGQTFTELRAASPLATEPLSQFVGMSVIASTAVPDNCIVAVQRRRDGSVEVVQIINLAPPEETPNE